MAEDLIDATTIDGASEFVEQLVLPGVAQTLAEEHSLPAIAFVLVQLDDELKFLDQPRALPASPGESLNEAAAQVRFAETLRRTARSRAAVGVVVACEAETREHGRRVVISLEHLQGRRFWTAPVLPAGAGEFSRGNGGWEKHPFQNLLPVEVVN